ncbi:hypothetical protein M426DRAFT_15402 [Hypoxylon sp. CI-4A]|nr:hypothetical protein M426DRAFT_15402 [Hypoxylon sp. CI-4A]
MPPIARRNGRTAAKSGQVAIASRAHGGANAQSLTSNRNSDPSWLWPPALYQPYCKLHFLKECALYHLQESEKFKLTKESLKPKRSSKWPAEPTRVQPSRRAREKSNLSRSGTPSSDRDSPVPEASGNRTSASTPESLHEKLRLHLPWPVYKTRLEDKIKEISSGLCEEIPRDSNGVFWGLECRYCRFNSEIVDHEGSISRKLVAPAPMHFVSLEDMREEQIGTFGGIQFALVKIGEDEAIVLFAMETLENC